MSRFLSLRLNPVARKRWQRFRASRRAWYSLLALAALYLASLGAELLCNDRPLYLRYEGRSYFPAFFFYAEDAFTGNGLLTRPDYKAVNASPAFAEDDANFMIFPPLPFGPQEIIKEESIPVADHVDVSVRPAPRVAAVDVDADLVIRRRLRAGWFFQAADDAVVGLGLRDHYPVTGELADALARRFANLPAAPYAAEVQAGERAVKLELSPYQPRRRPPARVRLLLREAGPQPPGAAWRYEPDAGRIAAAGGLWDALSAEQREEVRRRAADRVRGPAAPLRLEHQGVNYRATFEREDVRFPFRPVGRHFFGLDDTGRDVLARVFYGMRTSLNFGLLLVVASLAVGVVIGALQGYYGGKIDLVGQRLTEIWEALPFLYVLILLGSVYGRSFLLLLTVYGLFNWIGVSYYMRAEFLRLRNQPFVEAALGLGLPDRKVLFSHILPNALAPLTTFFPFYLVGAIGALAALDYLGFGLPPPTASWGQLLAQAQGQLHWWLILYPSLALFLVILLCVFIGEGVRDAFDPRKYTRLS